MNVTIEILEKALRRSWSRETCYEPLQEDWTQEKPEAGQCYVTALILHDYLGGEILKTKGPDGFSHYWNVIDGEEIDLTRSQFEHGWLPGSSAVLAQENIKKSARYKMLKSRVEELLG